ncbi:hypothetical protein [Xanthomonas theicola]|uniref:Uncharacterized protein n=1 Tax=Xanthomonas theicola TaxID=56464 RepID=A0A2S6ZM58_9XANT|nr:hypothetical protein [Xanthomonas theicola]PPT93351.1 hypothetical protein XthCFBP4691_00315 [Xanthomonas theicola]QNH25542.1 hypothetical protein G4Q83_13355 [Xanthomonas theicola]
MDTCSTFIPQASTAALFTRSGIAATLVTACLVAPFQAHAAERTALRIGLHVVGACELNAAAGAPSCGGSQPLAVSRAEGGPPSKTAALTPASPQFATPDAATAKRGSARFTTFTF